MLKYFQESTGTLYLSEDIPHEIHPDLVKVVEPDPGLPPAPPVLRRTASDYGVAELERDYFSTNSCTIVRGHFDLSRNPDLKEITGTQPYGAYEPTHIPGAAP